jgi:FtsH-binding integral membrane protein
MRNYNQTLSDNQKNKESFTQSFWLMIFELGIIILLALVPMPSWLKFILFSCFSYLFGITLSYLNTPSNTAIIQASIVGTISIFASMFLLGLILILFGVQLGLNVGLFLFFSLLALILFNIISVFMNAFSVTYKVITVIGMLLFSLYIVYDTNIIIQREYYGDFITASMDYYLDILNIFINFVTFYENN